MHDYIKQLVTTIVSYYQESIDAIETTHRADIDVTIINLRISPNSIFNKRDGELLKALNTVVKSIVAQKNDAATPFLIDINNFYFHYIEDLKKTTKNIIEKVKQTQKSFALPPQHAFDRMLTHHFIKEDGFVESKSDGEGFERHIVISVKSE